jgi:membrane fusion protein, multidrug efflux system
VSARAGGGAPIGEHGGGSVEEPHDERRRAGRLLFIAGVMLLVANVLTVAALSMHRRHVEDRARSERAEDVQRGPRLLVARVEVSQADRELTLPAEARAFAQATLNAKVGGYVREVRAERGRRVKRGDVLAIIESPESDQDVVAARSDADTKRRIAARANALAPSGVVSQQDREEAVNAARLAEATLGRARAQRGYTELRAPFDGVVTGRYVDPGAFLPAGAVVAPILEVATVDRLRVFSYVGQEVAPFVHPGDVVTLWQDELPGKRIPASVTHVAGALDPRTRTMQCEIVLDNRPWGVLPGTFVRVTFQLHLPPSPVVPNEAIVIRDGQTHVALVDVAPDDGARSAKVRLVPVDLGPNDGRTTRVTRGLSGGETVGLSVPVDVGEGSAVQAVPAPPPSSRQPPQSSGAKR